MKNIRTKYPLLTFYFAIIKKVSIESKYPGGLYKFSREYNYQYNDDLIVINDMGSGKDGIFFNLEIRGLKDNEDYHIGMEPPVKDLEFIKNTPSWLKISYNNSDRLYVEYIDDITSIGNLDGDLEELIKDINIKAKISVLTNKFKN